MYHSRSSRIKILLDSNQITHFIPIRRVDGKVYPFHLVPQDAEILSGFVWKPGDRPTSKEDILARKRAPEGAELLIPADSAAQGQPASDSRPNNDSTQAELPPDSTALDSVAADSLHKNRVPPDSLSAKDTVRMDSLRADSTLKRDPIQQTGSISVIVDDLSPISIGRPYLWKRRTKLGNSSPKNLAILPSEIGYPKSIAT